MSYVKDGFEQYISSVPPYLGRFISPEKYSDHSKVLI